MLCNQGSEMQDISFRAKKYGAILAMIFTKNIKNTKPTKTGG